MSVAKRRRLWPLILAALLGMVRAEASDPAGFALPALQDSFMNRPTDVTAILTRSPRYSGLYKSSQVSRICGETDPALFSMGERRFLVEYPAEYDGHSEIVDLVFRSNSLVGTVRETEKFFVSITVKSPKVGRAPAYVVDTERPVAAHSGRASLIQTGQTAELRVQAVNTLGESLDLTIVCKPKDH